MTQPRFNLAKVQFVLEKRNINDIPCQVKFGMDVSGSTRSLFNDGVVQSVTDKIFTIAMTVDVDKSLDFTAFDDDSYELPAVTAENVTGYIDKHLSTKNSKYWGGTSYAPVIKKITESVAATNKPSFVGKLFGRKTAAPLPPTLAIMITDGANDDKRDTKAAIEASQNQNVYWQLVGIGTDANQFRFLEELADAYPNVGYTPITDIVHLPEEDLYDSLLNDEFAAWVAQFK